VLAVASREPDRAAAFARDLDIPHAVAGYADLLAREDVDAVYVALPNVLHAEWCIAAARAGKHVLCEKPLAATRAEAEAVAQAARQHGVLVAEAFMYRHHPRIARLAELVRGGAIGRPVAARGNYSFQMDAARRAVDVRMRTDLLGGVLLDIGC